jgi:hypothetical protein
MNAHFDNTFEKFLELALAARYCFPTQNSTDVIREREA